jgi:hypothetical protein
MFGGKDTALVPDKEKLKPAVDEPAEEKLTLEDVLLWMPPTPHGF